MTQQIYFFKVCDIDTPIQPRKKKHQTNISSALKSFRTTCGVSEIIAKIWIFAIISETPQVVLKRFSGRTNIILMFLFPWLDWGIDISDLKKIDFLGHGAILGCSQPLGRLILNSSDIYAGGQKIFKKSGMRKKF